MPRYFLLIIFAVIFACGKGKENNPPQTPPEQEDTTVFKNPLLPSGPDPWVVQKDGFYYYMNTRGDRITLRKTASISDLSKSAEIEIWKGVAGTAYSDDVWAPELHYLDNKWYIYFAADSAGFDSTHRLYVLENSSADPTAGNWELKGKITDSSDQWAIDGSVVQYKENLYLLWSGWETTAGGKQNIYIAKMSNPWTLEGNRVMISEPTEAWERSPFPVNEGPEGLVNEGRLFLTYSASFCGTDDYCLGLLSLQSDGDPLDPDDWQKSNEPVFTKNISGNAFGPGHNGFFVAPDGKHWIIYHANNFSGQGCSDNRNPRIQPFTFGGDGTPEFGNPVALDTKLPKP